VTNNSLDHIFVTTNSYLKGRLKMKNFFSLQQQYSISQQRLEQMSQKYGSQHPKVLLQCQKVYELFNQMQQIIVNYKDYIVTQSPSPVRIKP
jgi:uncharacterized protein involved in exopolysaccharide biosynthesis